MKKIFLVSLLLICFFQTNCKERLVHKSPPKRNVAPVPSAMRSSVKKNLVATKASFISISLKDLYKTVPEKNLLFAGKLIAHKGKAKIYFGCHPFKDRCYRAIPPKVDANHGLEYQAVVMFGQKTGLALNPNFAQSVIPAEPLEKIGIVYRLSCRGPSWPPGDCFGFRWAKRTKCKKKKGTLIEGRGQGGYDLCRYGMRADLSEVVKIPRFHSKPTLLNPGNLFGGKIVASGKFDYLAAAEEVTGKKCTGNNTYDESIVVKRGIPEMVYRYLLTKREPMDENEAIVIRRVNKNGQITFVMRGFKCS